MGVPHLFGYFARRYPHVVRTLEAERESEQQQQQQQQPRALYVDFNSVVHGSARAPGVAGPGDLEGRVIAESIAHLGRLEAALRPTDLVYVAVDGVPPMAKMQQQRQRRFMAVQQQQQQQQPPRADAPDGWEPNAVTPGTAFMARLCSELRAHSDARRAQQQQDRGGCPLLLQPLLVVTDSSEPGEGEQKIFRHMLRAPAGRGGARRVRHGR
jgi:5'-3' exonuclease